MRWRIRTVAATAGLAFALPLLAMNPFNTDGEIATDREVVVALHGLARSGSSMRILAKRLRAGGYRVEIIDYPSTDATMEELVGGIDRAVRRCCADAPRVHFVTYSLGGIVARAYLETQPLPQLGRVVMLAPPNRGSEWVDRLGEYRAFRSYYGPVGSDLGTSEASLPNQLGPPNFEFGVIAGTRAINPLGWFLIPGENDGTVAVENTKLPGMRDFLTVPHSHTFIMNAPAVATATLRFLETGRFRDERAPQWSERPRSSFGSRVTRQRRSGPRRVPR